MTFTLDLTRWSEATKARVDLAVRKISLELFTRVILRSPVDTGRFRGNWQVSIGPVANSTLEIDDKSGSATVSKATAEVLNFRAGDVITLVNNLPYAYRLENGWSKQAPAGMVGLSIVEFQPIVEKVSAELNR